MTDIVMVDSVSNDSVDVIENFFDAISTGNGGNGARITAFTASNNTTASASYKAYIYNSSGAMLEAVIPQKIVVRDRFDLGPSIISHIIPAGGSLRMESSTAESITFRVTGKEL